MVMLQVTVHCSFDAFSLLFKIKTGPDSDGAKD
jgi:hypothetical protein